MRLNGKVQPIIHLKMISSNSMVFPTVNAEVFTYLLQGVYVVFFVFFALLVHTL